MIAKYRGGEIDHTTKYTFIFGCKAASYQLFNKRLMYEFAQCLLMNFDPITMTVDLPDIFNNIKGFKPE